MTDLKSLFTPARVAVVGATESQSSVGRAVMENLEDFDGEVVPVNPNQDTVFGRECYPNIETVPDSIDLAVVAVPANAAIDVLGEIASANVKDVVVLTSEFDDDQEANLTEIAENHDLTLVGPNCLGIMNTENGLNATFNPPEVAVPSGPISFMSQSGGFISAVLDRLVPTGTGFNETASLGNKAVLGSVDFLRHWGEDDQTDVILAYLEDIENGRAFIDVGREVTTETPLIVLKAGQTEAGEQSASSHTGAMAGSAEAVRAGIDQAGAIRATDTEEFLDFGRVLTGQSLPDSDSVGIITNTGGPGVLASDAIDESPLSLVSFTDETQEMLADALPDGVDITNPLDIVGDATAERYRDALDAVLADENIASVIVLACPTAVLDYDNLAEVITNAYADHDTPLVTCLMGDGVTDSAVETLRNDGIPNHFDPSRVVRNLRTLAEYREIRNREYDSPTEFEVDEERARDVFLQVEERESDHLGLEAIEMLDAYGIPTPKGEVVDSPDAAEELAQDIDGSVVMKIASPDIPHKSDFGGVAMSVATDDVRETFENLCERAREEASDATILGVLVQKQVDIDDSQEVIVGVNRDPQFGPVVMFGYGGIFVQVFDDTTFRVAPVTESEAQEMTEEIDSAALLRGSRGHEAVDLDAVVETIQRVSQLVIDFPAITELDINPLVAGPNGVYAIDLRITVDSNE